MKKAKKSTASKAKTLPKKTRAKSKSKIQVKAKAKSGKATVKRKVARKPRPLSAEDLQLQQITLREERRGVIPQGAEGDSWSSVKNGKRPSKKALPRKIMTKKKPIFPQAHSD